MTRRWVGNALILLAVGFAVYLCAVMGRRVRAVALKDGYMKVFRYELAVCAVFILCALDVRFQLFTRLLPENLAPVGRCLRVALGLAVALILFLAGRVVAGGFIRTAGPADHAIVLGLALEDGAPTGDLLSRLDAAQGYWRAHPGTKLILTGGNPDASGRTEADVMRDLLAARGVPGERLVLEDRAETTRDNFRNTARMIDPTQPVVLISSNYHMDRAVRTAKSAGFSQILRLPAPSDPLSFGANMMWEVILDLNELTK